MRGKSRSTTRRPHHADIMRLMKQIQMSDDDPAVVQEKRLNTTLNAVNAAGYLSDVQRRAPSGLQVFGPKSLQRQGWAGAVLWMKRNGYHTYKMITLLGIWAQMQDEDLYVIVGTRPLLYQAPIYAPDSYFHQIKRDFRLYYGKDAAPPTSATQLYTAPYVPENRLAIRQQIEGALGQWRDTQLGR